jgi:hypothetical protein
MSSAGGDSGGEANPPRTDLDLIHQWFAFLTPHRPRALDDVGHLIGYRVPGREQMYVSTYPDGILHMMAMTLFEENNDNTRGNIIDALTRAPSFFETPGFLTKLIDVAFQQDVSSSAVQHTSPSVQRQEGRNNDVLPDVTGPVEDVLNRNNHAHQEKTRQKSGSESAKKGGRPLDNVRGRPPLQNSSSRHL